MLTHLLDPDPTEIYIFINLKARKPLNVPTAFVPFCRIDGTHVTNVRRPMK